MRYQKVLIVTVPKQDTTRPPGILSILAATCEQVNVEYDIFDLNLHMHKTLSEDQAISLNSDFGVNEFSNQTHASWYTSVCQDLLNRIKEFNPDLVAISVFTHLSILATDHLLKMTQNRNYHIVIGGIGVSDKFSPITNDLSFGEYCRAQNLVDYCVTGEGELSFEQLLQGNTQYSGINGIPSQQITDLDSLPTPSYKKINAWDYFYSNSPELLITGSRGCVRSCSFCNVAATWKNYIYQSGDKIANNMYEMYKTTGVHKFDFSDSLINGSIKSFRALNRRLIELRKLDPSFRPLYKGQFICRPIGQLKSSDYEEMKLAGAETLIIGIEHFSQSVRTHMNKHFDNAAIDWHFQECARLDIKNVLLLLSGYVNETLDDHQQMLDGLIRYQKYAMTKLISSINIEVGGLGISPGMPLWEQAEELGLIVDQDQGSMWVNTNNLTLTPKERLRRATEVIIVAAKHGYSILHFRQKLSKLKRLVQLYEHKKQNSKFKILPIRN